MRCVTRSALSDRRGGTIIEFALVVMPFLFLTFAILEIGLIFVANASLANATLALGRQIRVGKVMASGKAITTSSGLQMDLADFKAAICNLVTLVPTTICKSQLQIDLRTQTSFASQSTPATGSSGTFNTSNLCFYSGSAGDIVVMRAYYLWTIQTPLLLTPLANVTSVTTGSGTATGNFFVLLASEVFRNEPSSAPTNNGSGC